MTAAAWIVGFLIFFPILWTVLTSFKTELDAFAMPPKFLFFHWTLENYGVVQERSNYLRVRLQFDRAVDRRQLWSDFSSPFRRRGRWRSRRPSPSTGARRAVMLRDHARRHRRRRR